MLNNKEIKNESLKPKAGLADALRANLRRRKKIKKKNIVVQNDKEL